MLTEIKWWELVSKFNNRVAMLESDIAQYRTFMFILKELLSNEDALVNRAVFEQIYKNCGLDKSDADDEG